jgi:beta-lactamase class A
MKFSQTAKAICLIIIGAGIGMAVIYSFQSICIIRYAMINSKSACGHRAAIDKTGYMQTQEDISQFIKGSRATGKIAEASIYFRDLQDGPVFGVNELTEFVPASLLKLPVALAYLSEAERNPSLLSVELKYEGDQAAPDLSQAYMPAKTLEVGSYYTIEKLLEYMLQYSDNRAYDILEQYQVSERPGNLENIFFELGLTVSDNPYAEILGARRYASLFRILYNVSYLNTELSNKVLAWLSKSDFNQGLVAGIPPNIKVAHKFGERTMSDGTYHLHDCGIVYYPNNPYLICVMTQGANFEELAKVIETISRTVYGAVDSRRL